MCYLVSITTQISIGDIINSLIALIAIGTLYIQWVFNRKSLEYAYQPIFEFHPFPPPTRGTGVFFATDKLQWTPRSCQEHNPINGHKCNRDHWFNITNDSEFPAINCEIFIMHSKEIDIKKVTFKNYDDRVSIYPMITKKDDIQYKIAPKSIDISLYDPNSTDCFYVCIRYKTINNSNYFLHIYSLSYQPYQSDKWNNWRTCIDIFGVKSLGFRKLNQIFPEWSTKRYFEKLSLKIKQS